MENIILEFNSKVEEINEYFDFIKLTTHIRIEDEGKIIISKTVHNVLKANMFLMLYNLMESSVTAAIEQIHVSIEKNNISFDSLKDGIKTKLIKYLQNNKNATKFINEINEISTDIILSCFDKKKLYSGNLSRNEIKSLAKEYNFSSDSEFDETKHGEKLDIVKKLRNDLAHGTFSFKEVGRDYDINKIAEFKNEVISYLKQIISNIEEYINNKGYLT